MSVTAMDIEKEKENSPVEQVALTVVTTDDTTLPAVTFRMWVLGAVCCVVLSFLNQFFTYRRNPLYIGSIAAQIAVVPVGHFMARVLPKKELFSGTKFAFSLNPGPFNIKEHVLITIFANTGAGVVYAIHIATSLKVYYFQKISFLTALLVLVTTQVLGFGWAGLFRKYLVEPAAMWWPSNLVQVSIFRSLHEVGERGKGRLSRNQFFIIAITSSFAYTIVPNYFFNLVSFVSWICWIFPNSVTAHQIGSGKQGMGLGSIGFDWAAASSYLPSPLASPWFATANIAAGYFIIVYVITPIIYWNNFYDAKSFPIISPLFYKSTGQRYPILSIVDSNFHLDVNALEKQGPLHLTTFFAITYGVGFAALTATLSHVAIFYGKDIIRMARSALSEKEMDVHTRMMKKYKQVPDWWFICILIPNIALALFTCLYYKDTIQLPWWGLLFACVFGCFFTLPVGIITATTNQMPGLNIITEYLMGLLLPGRPAANVCFKTYGYISCTQAVIFLSDFKLGHYMKIPPRSMFMAQVVGTLISGVVYLSTAWWLMETIPNICNTDVLPPDSPWTCSFDRVFFDASVIWGLVGPRRVFGSTGIYTAVNWFFLVGALAPVLVWIATKIFPNQKWIRLINAPVLIGATGMMPPAQAVNYNSWILMGFLSGFVAYRYKRDWWKRFNYVLSGGLDAGTAFATVLLFFALQNYDIVAVNWWGNAGEGCPLASCPTQKGIIIDGCPVF